MYTETNQRNMSIRFLVKKRTLPEYFDESSSAYDVIHEQLMQAERSGYLTLVWKQKKAGHILEACVLNTDRLDEVYQYLRRAPKRERQTRAEQILDQYSGRGPVLSRFCGWIRERLAAGESVKRYVDLDDVDSLERLCRLVCGILENQEELYLREFSVRHFKDTKIAEREIGRAVEVIRQFSDRFEDLTTDQVLEEFSIYRNPSWVMMKGSGSFSLLGSTVDLADLEGGIGIHSGDLGRIRWKAASGQNTPGWEYGSGQPKAAAPEQRQPKAAAPGQRQVCSLRRVLTIENLTTFHRIREEDTLVIYLAGFHNRVKREFLMRLYEAFPEAEYRHFGDLDCGGFLIWKNLCVNTGIPFEPWKMDVKTLEGNLEYGKALTEHDRRQLGRMMDDPFFERQIPLFERMLEVGRKVEQEGIR